MEEYHTKKKPSCIETTSWFLRSSLKLFLTMMLKKPFVNQIIIIKSTGLCSKSQNQGLIQCHLQKVLNIRLQCWPPTLFLLLVTKNSSIFRRQTPLSTVEDFQPGFVSSWWSPVQRLKLHSEFLLTTMKSREIFLQCQSSTDCTKKPLRFMKCSIFSHRKKVAIIPPKTIKNPKAKIKEVVICYEVLSTRLCYFSEPRASPSFDHHPQ